jgi:GNAT superfamily N-acetyltransferase
MTDGPELRPVTVDDIEALLEHVRTGLASYVEFAPPGWEPPPRDDRDRDRMVRFLSDVDTWALLAVTPERSVGHASERPAGHVSERSVGHVSFIRGRELPDPDSGGVWLDQPPIPGLAHLWQLFVMPESWGSGVADRLHHAAVVEMADRGYSSARLYTPSAHARARRFYERNGWHAVGGRAHPGMGLDLAEYRRPLP